MHASDIHDYWFVSNEAGVNRVYIRLGRAADMNPGMRDFDPRQARALADAIYAAAAEIEDGDV